jgi:hypothetical protein
MFGKQPSLESYRTDDRILLTSWFAHEKSKRYSLRSLPAAKNLAHVDPSLVATEAALATTNVPTHPVNGYSRLDAATGNLILQSVQRRLPHWESEEHHGHGRFARIDRMYALKGRLLSFIPQHLFTITWPGRKPGLAGPIAYHLVWLPVFDRFVVTASVPTREGNGYCDFALESFRAHDVIEQKVGNIVYRDWRRQFVHWCVKQRAEVYATGIIGYDFANKVAERAWTDPHQSFDRDGPTRQAPRRPPKQFAPLPPKGLNATIVPFP